MKTKIIFIIALMLGGNMLSGQDLTRNEKRRLLSFEQFEEVFNRAGGDKAQILDARSAEEYEQNHVRGAVNVDTDESFHKTVTLLDKSRPVFVYSIGNGRSARLAKQLDSLGFVEVYEFPGGLSRWIGEGKPVVSTVGEGLTQNDFQQTVSSDEWVLVDLTSRYCPGCKKLDAVLDNVKKEIGSKVKLVKIEAYENKKLVNELRVKGLPTLLLYQKGKLVWQKSGSSTEDELLAKLGEYLY